MSYIPTPADVVNPRWTGRNAAISKHIIPQSSVIDMGCGGKDLLRYISPSRYVGVDYNGDHADLIIDFNAPFTIEHGWDYLVCSGLIEYLSDVQMFMKSVQNMSKCYIFTLWKDFHTLNNPNALTYDDYISTVKGLFNIVDQDMWHSHLILICKDLTD